VGEQLCAEAHAEHGQLARDRAAQQRCLGPQRRVVLDVEDRLLAAERDDPVDGVEVGQRVAAAHVALVERHPGLAQDGAGVAAERPLEVVQDGDGRRGHRADDPIAGCMPSIPSPYAVLDRSQMLMPASTA
jgi:hypothetical protein